jgi:hypothetical protein
MHFIIKKKVIGFLLLYLLILFYFYFLKSSSYIENDEIVNINTYLYPELITLKNYPNNHIFTSFFGIIIKYLFGINIIYLRLLSWFSFLGILYFFLRIFKNNITLSLFIILFSLSNYLFSYTILFRGYYFSSFLFVLIFYLLKKNNFSKDQKYLKTIFLLCSVLTFALMSNVYLVLPIIIGILFPINKKIIKDFLIYFIVPTFIFQIFSVIQVGISINSEIFSNFFSFNHNFFQLIIDNFSTIISSGIKKIFLSPFTVETLNLKIMVQRFTYDLSIIIIFLLSLFIAIYNFINNKRNIFDKVIILFFIIFFLMNKSPPLRAHIGYIYFFIFYIFLNFENKYNYKSSEIFKTNFLIMTMILSLLIINFKQKTILMQPVKYFTSDLDKNLFLNKKVEEDLQKCILTTEILEEHNKAYYFYLYQSKCGAVYDFRIFRNFYKNKKI